MVIVVVIAIVAAAAPPAGDFEVEHETIETVTFAVRKSLKPLGAGV